MTDTQSNVTELLRQAQAGDLAALSQLWERVAPEVRVIARRQLRGRKDYHGLSASELVNVAFLRLYGGQRTQSRLGDRAHFFAAVARAMRCVLVDQARRRKDCGVELNLDTLRDSRSPATTWGWTGDLEALDHALRAFEADPRNSRKATVVHLRFFAGRELPEIAEELGVSPETVKRDLRFSRAWLLRQMKGGASR